jgi:DNA-directed RNA polymerase specialized sigma24 family protein
MSGDYDYESVENVWRENSTARVDEILNEVNRMLKRIAREQLPGAIVRRGTEEMEADDLAQHTLIKLWEEMQKKTITHYRAYARSILHNAAMDMVRRYQPTSQLPLNEHGELMQGQLLFAGVEAATDPICQVERQDTLIHSMRMIVNDVLALPPQQRRAMICELKDQIADLLPIAEAFWEHGVDIRTINWSQDQRELRSQRVSLAVARKKLRACRQKYLRFSMDRPEQEL